MNNTTIVVSDLDGTLLDYYDYSWSKAVPALELLKERHIPLILCSSKTRTEMAVIRCDLDITDPYIVENGAAIYRSDGVTVGEDVEMVRFGMNRAEVIEILKDFQHDPNTLKAQWTGFSQMSVEELMAVTRLDKDSATRAQKREFTEPLLWQDEEGLQQTFTSQLAKVGLETVQGGRFIHVSNGCDKGRAVGWLRHYYKNEMGNLPHVIALGDSENDIGMLEIADVPVLVKSPVKAYPALQHQNVYRTCAEGPSGWNEALLKILGQ